MGLIGQLLNKQKSIVEQHSSSGGHRGWGKMINMGRKLDVGSKSAG